MNRTVKQLEEVCRKYGFSVGEGVRGSDKFVSLVAKNTDNDNVDWIKYYVELDTVGILGNTDQCNIWFCDTRKDFTPEKSIQFVADLNEALDLGEEGFLIRDLIDPEDWQEIANVHDAYADKRYYNK